MNSELLRQRAVLARSLAENADPFTKKRLLDLAKRYDFRAAGSGPLRASRGIGRLLLLASLAHRPYRLRSARHEEGKT